MTEISRPHTFDCIDGHTCGNPVRLVTSGGPDLEGATMAEKRLDFIERYDWIRTALMYEPRGHDIMSGAFLYPPTRDDCDAAILFIEVSGCLPMCGHGTIGAVTMALENNLVTPREEGRLMLDTPAGVVLAEYQRQGDYVKSVRFHNVPSFRFAENLAIECPELGRLKLDIAFGGNFYAIIEPQDAYPGLEAFEADAILHHSPVIRRIVNETIDAVHPLDPSIRGVSHVQWTGAPRDPKANARNAVFYGAKAIDRSPCGTGTSARMAQLAARGELSVGDHFVHESLIGTLFDGRVEESLMVGPFPAIRPSISGWARMTGTSRITVDERDPLWRGFQLS